MVRYVSMGGLIWCVMLVWGTELVRFVSMGDLSGGLCKYEGLIWCAM